MRNFGGTKCVLLGLIRNEFSQFEEEMERRKVVVIKQLNNLSFHNLVVASTFFSPFSLNYKPGVIAAFFFFLLCMNFFNKNI